MGNKDNNKSLETIQANQKNNGKIIVFIMHLSNAE